MWVRICPHVFETILARLKLKHLKTVRYFIAFVVADVATFALAVANFVVTVVVVVVVTLNAGDNDEVVTVDTHVTIVEALIVVVVDVIFVVVELLLS